MSNEMTDVIANLYPVEWKSHALRQARPNPETDVVEWSLVVDGNELASGSDAKALLDDNLPALRAMSKAKANQYKGNSAIVLRSPCDIGWMQ